MIKMTENQIIDVESMEVLEEPVSVSVSPEPLPIKTKEERAMEMERFNALKKMVKQKRRYYKSNLFQIQKLDPNK